ncbi:MAG TPA: hypothetical protein PL009_03500 [Flavipsychrobacter sp.]|nr:hypothetical protein [Flavipsychrobacter sp.]
MHIGSLKYNLLDKLIGVKDIDLLKRINDLIKDIPVDNSEFELTDKQYQMLLKSEEDIIAGRIISDEKLNEEEDRWLNE